MMHYYLIVGSAVRPETKEIKMTTIRQVASKVEIDYLIKNDLILPGMEDEEASEVVEEDGATFITIDGDLVVAIYPNVEPNAWRK